MTLIQAGEMMMTSQLQSLLDATPSLWRGHYHSGRARSISSGFDELDEALPTGGWPPGAVVELMVPGMGVGELSLWLPVIKRMTNEQRYVIIANPPYMPYAPALANAGVDLDYIRWLSLDDEQDTLWALEKALRNRECGMALWWPGTQRAGLNDSAVRRLQVAAREESHCWVSTVWRRVIALFGRVPGQHCACIYVSDRRVALILIIVRLVVAELEGVV